MSLKNVLITLSCPADYRKKWDASLLKIIEKLFY